MCVCVCLERNDARTPSPTTVMCVLLTVTCNCICVAPRPGFVARGDARGHGHRNGANHGKGTVICMYSVCSVVGVL